MANNWISVGLFSILSSKDFTLLLEARVNEFGQEREHHGSSVSPFWMVVVQCRKGALYYHHSFVFLVATVVQRELNQPSFLIQVPRPQLLLFLFSTIPPPLLAFLPIQSDSTSFYHPPPSILGCALLCRNRLRRMANLGGTLFTHLSSGDTFCAAFFVSVSLS